MQSKPNGQRSRAGKGAAGRQVAGLTGSGEAPVRDQEMAAFMQAVAAAARPGLPSTPPDAAGKDAPDPGAREPAERPRSAPVEAPDGPWLIGSPNFFVPGEPAHLSTAGSSWASTEVPARSSSAPLFDPVAGAEGTSEALAGIWGGPPSAPVLDRKGTNLFAFRPEAKMVHQRAPSPVVGDTPVGSPPHRTVRPEGDSSPVPRHAPPDGRFTPPPQLRKASATHSRSPPGLASPPGRRSPSQGAGAEDGPVLLHPAVVRAAAVDAFDRAQTASPILHSNPFVALRSIGGTPTVPEEEPRQLPPGRDRPDASDTPEPPAVTPAPSAGGGLATSVTQPRSPSPPWESDPLHAAAQAAAAQAAAAQAAAAQVAILDAARMQAAQHAAQAQARLQLQPQVGAPGVPAGYAAHLSSMVAPLHLRQPCGSLAAAQLPLWQVLGCPQAAAHPALAASIPSALAQGLPPVLPQPLQQAAFPEQLHAGPLPLAATDPAPAADAAKDRKPRAAFKISELEGMFAADTFFDRVCAIARDQAGCRMLQHRLERAAQEGKTDVVDRIFDSCLSSIVDLMMDPFGNYLCQKLMELCSQSQLEQMVDRARGSLATLSLNLHGARAVQKLIEASHRAPVTQRHLAASLDGSIVQLSRSANGNHVVSKCLESLPAECHSFIIQAVATNIVVMASDRHGCRIVQRCVDLACGEERRRFIGSITREAFALVQDPFGNYAVQYVLKTQDAQANSSDVISAMLGCLAVLSRQKFSSNVVEACLKVGSPQDRERMIGELADPRSLPELLRDVFGNYVVQSALSVAVEPLLTLLLQAVLPCLPALRASGGQGRRIAQKLEKKYPRLRVEIGAALAAPGRPNSCAAASGGPPPPAEGLVAGPSQERARRARPRREGARMAAR